MTFEEALMAMRKGKRVRRVDWTKATWLFMRDGKIYSGVDNVGHYCGQFGQALIVATDWELEQ